MVPWECTTHPSFRAFRQARLEALKARANAAHPSALHTTYRVFERVGSLGSAPWPSTNGGKDHPGDLVVPRLPQPPAHLAEVARASAATEGNDGEEDGEEGGSDGGGGDAAIYAALGAAKGGGGGGLTFKHRKAPAPGKASGAAAGGGCGSGGGEEDELPPVRCVADLARQLAELRRRVEAATGAPLPPASPAVGEALGAQVEGAAAEAATAAPPGHVPASVPPPPHASSSSAESTSVPSEAALSGASTRLMAALAAISAGSSGGGVGGTSDELGPAITALASAAAAAEALAALLGHGGGGSTDALLPSDWSLLCAYRSFCVPFWVAAGTLANAAELVDELSTLTEVDCIPAADAAIDAGVF